MLAVPSLAPSLTGLSSPGRSAALQIGRASDVAVVSFSREPVTEPVRVGRAAPWKEGYGQPLLARDGMLPDGAALRAFLLDQAQARMERQLARVETSLRRTYRLTGGPALGADQPLSTLLEPERLSALPEKLAAALKAWSKAVETASGLAPSAEAEPPGPEETRALIERAVIDQVDAKLAAETAMDEAEFARRMAVLALFGDAGRQMAGTERAVMLGRFAERLGRRGEMISQMKQDIASGAISVTVTAHRLPGGPGRVAVDAPPGVEVSVLARSQYLGAVSWTRAEPAEGTLLDVSS
ncbi:hypothetical protein [Oceanicella sp. SM1341]|uniref:hypothetical protein n=1 Tax=Oceanicella sp. SM1341 TaxID=1548889 RepID=UPI00130053F0|nr:hypothetical protein [Oceanicella sp. SM1341]